MPGFGFRVDIRLCACVCRVRDGWGKGERGLEREEERQEQWRHAMSVSIIRFTLASNLSTPRIWFLIDLCVFCFAILLPLALPFVLVLFFVCICLGFLNPRCLNCGIFFLINQTAICIHSNIYKALKQP